MTTPSSSTVREGDVNALVAEGGTVMMEGAENYHMGGKHFALITDQIEAAGLAVPQ